MTFFARHIPGLASALALILCLLLIVLGHKRTFQHLLVVPTSETAHIAPTVQAYFNRPDSQSIIRSLSKSLAPRQPIRRLAYIILLAFTPPLARVATYLHHTSFGPAWGIKRAASYYFGIHRSRLTTGEILLLCDLAQGGDVPINNPIAALKRRAALLTDLLNQGLLTPSDYHTECNRALSLSADHRPVN